MRRLLALLVLCGSAWAGTCGTGYNKYKSITIDHTKVVSTMTNFAVMVFMTDADLKTTGNGGDVETSQGYDIIVCDANTGSGNQIAHELAGYSATTGKIELYFLVSSLSASVDTVRYLFYGKSGATDTSNKTSVWTAYAAVYHLGDGTTLDLNDSSPNGNNLSNINTVTASAGNYTFGGATFSRASTTYLRHSSPSGIPTNQARVDVLLYKFTSATPGNDMVFQSYGKDPASGGDWANGVNFWWQDGAATFWWGRLGARTREGPYTPDTNWHFAAGAAPVTPSSTVYTRWDNVYPAGNADGYSGNLATDAPTKLTLGCSVNTDMCLNGQIEEFRIYYPGADFGSTYADIMTTLYNNLVNPGTFYAIGTETAGPGGSGTSFVRRPPVIQ